MVLTVREIYIRQTLYGEKRVLAYLPLFKYGRLQAGVVNKRVVLVREVSTRDLL